MKTVSRLFVALASLLVGIVNLLVEVLRLLSMLVTSLTAFLARARKASVNARFAPPPAARPATAPMGAPQVAAERVTQPMAPPAAWPMPTPPIATPAPTRRFVAPSVDCLARRASAPTVNQDGLQAQAAKLVETLAQHGIDGKVEDILPGPTVTTYEVSPAAGTKVSKVAALADDLSLALARKVRIVAPIPGKNRVGFEMPSDTPVPVSLRGLIEDPAFLAFDAALPIVLGRDSVGRPVYGDLATMPHLIVAGATGAGKSVGINAMLLSLLYRRSPDEMRLLLIDPKVVELAPFARIPHMLLPVVTDMKQAAAALQWAVSEMERRYQLFADAGARSLASYNARPSVQRLPFIVIVIDEFADLMMQEGKTVRPAVARLAQKARASGIHVILATQRPSVEVIPGDIRANFPSRIAYRVAQAVDSRVVLDEQGAEHLLGRGDALVRLNGEETRRVQCPWVSEGDVQRVTNALRAQGEPIYDNAILQPAHGQRSLRVVA